MVFLSTAGGGGALIGTEKISNINNHKAHNYTKKVVTSAHADKDSDQRRCCRPAEREIEIRVWRVLK